MKTLPAVSPTIAPTRIAAPPTIMSACDWLSPAPLATVGDDVPAGMLTRTPAVRASRVGPTWSTALALLVLRTDNEDVLSEESISDCARLTGARRTSANTDNDNRAARERTFIAFSFRGLVKRRKIRAIPRICPE